MMQFHAQYSVYLSCPIFSVFIMPNIQCAYHGQYLVCFIKWYSFDGWL